MNRLFVLAFAWVTFFSAEASHLRCGFVSIKKVSGLTYTVKLTVYTYLQGTAVRFEGGNLAFGDGSSHITPRVENTLLPGYSGVGIVEYSIDHTFPSNNTYTISYNESNLRGGILNMSNSVNTKFYIQLRTNLNSDEDCSTPEFLTHPILENTINQFYAFSNAGYTVNGGYLRYQLGILLQARGILVGSLKIPKSLAVNYYNGLVTWDNILDEGQPFPYLGDYLFSVDIFQYNPNGNLINVIQRTFQIILNDTDSKIEITNPIADTNGKIFIESGKAKTIKVLLDGEGIKTWGVNYDLKIASNLNFAQYDSTVNSKQVRVASLKLNSTPQIVRDEPYSITLRASGVSQGNPVNYKDVAYLFFTKDIDLPDPVITQTNELKHARTEVYPNPFSNSLNVNIENELEPEAVGFVFNTLGKVVLTSKLNGNSVLDTSSLPAGIYFLQVGNLVTKVIKN